jgi:membrane protease YdiL (CAAX protease family)
LADTSEDPTLAQDAERYNTATKPGAGTSTTFFIHSTSSIVSPYGTGTSRYTLTIAANTISSARHSFTPPEAYRARDEQSSPWQAILTLLSTAAAFGLPLFALIVTGRRLFARIPITALAWRLGAGLIILFLMAQVIGLWPYPPGSSPLLILLSTLMLAVAGLIFYGLPSIGALLARAEVAERYHTTAALRGRLRTLLAPVELAHTVTYAYLFTLAGILLIIGTELIIPSLDDYTPVPPLIRLLMLAEHPVLYVATSFVLLPAISEELLYRFFAVRIFAARLHSVIAGAALSSILFALGHLDPATGSAAVISSAIFFTLGGLGLAYIYLRHGIFTAILTHAVYNATLGGITLIGLYPEEPHIVILTGTIVLTPAVASLVIATVRTGRGVEPVVEAGTRSTHE